MHAAGNTAPALKHEKNGEHPERELQAVNAYPLKGERSNGDAGQTGRDHLLEQGQVDPAAKDHQTENVHDHQGREQEGDRMGRGGGQGHERDRQIAEGGPEAGFGDTDDDDGDDRHRDQKGISHPRRRNWPGR